MDEMFAVYLLLDENRTPRYVGITKNPDDRFKRHIRESRAKRTHRQCWINSMVERGLIPSMEVVEWTKDWATSEREWVFKMKALGFPLTNGNEGGTDMPQMRGENSADHKNPYFKKIMCRSGNAIKDSQFFHPSEVSISRIRKAQRALRQSHVEYTKAGALDVFEYRCRLYETKGILAVKEFDKEAERLYGESHKRS